ncbi:hypothetical protein LL972_15120, partial [Xanthomonas campestris pv. asclepiadis]|uniref:hypothetical protein n=1 Tax=Xanthomonas campestris TaxID=339 RepID=UPI001E2D47DD
PSGGAIVQPQRRRSCNYRLRNGANQETLRVIRAKETSRTYKKVTNVVGIIDTLEPGPGEMIQRDWTAEPMVRCSDSVVRRYPSPGWEPSPNYLSQISEGWIYSAPSDRVTQRFGALGVTDDNQRAFMVAGHPVSPISIDDFEAYALPNGKFMVPQPGFTDCSSACELMMRLDHQEISVVGNSGRLFMGARRSMSEIASSLRAKTGMEPVSLQYKNISYKRILWGGLHEARKGALRDIGKKIDEMGPCIFSAAGHVVMLDGVREGKENFYLSIREPFHGEVLEFKDTRKFFFRDRKDANDVVDFEAIFLKQP